MLYSLAPRIAIHAKPAQPQLPDLAKFAEGNSAAPQGDSAALAETERPLSVRSDVACRTHLSSEMRRFWSFESQRVALRGTKRRVGVRRNHPEVA